ncbi:hypothetical protein PENSPDRAFT_684383 [Peniophora sp. CONT]|nr:hypothetical protein PENSPDRAFT_684383 [Peniophora sp. CONT]
MAILDAFKLDEFNLKPILEIWDAQNPPRFYGKTDVDPPVDIWLDAIKAGCLERGVPEGYWHKVGQHYLGPRARERYNELKRVMRTMHGGKYRFDWKRFKVAMRSMGWDIEDSKTESFKLQSRASGHWWIAGRGSSSKERQEPPVPYHPLYAQQNRSAQLEAKQDHPVPYHPAYAQKRPSPPEKRHTLPGEKPDKRERKRKTDDTASVEFVDDWDSVVSTADSGSRPSVARRMTDWITRKDTAPASDAASESAETASSYTPNMFYAQTPSVAPSTVPSTAPSASSSKNAAETSSISSFWPFGGQSTSPPATTTTLSTTSASSTEPTEELSTATANVPVWLLNATGALEFLNTEHPKMDRAEASVRYHIIYLPSREIAHVLVLTRRSQRRI